MIVYTPIEGFSGAAGHHPLFLRWREMKKRCQNPKHGQYKYYGAKGIRVCDRWLDFGLFVADMGMPPSPTYTIERNDSNKDYCLENCRWATTTEQSRNKSSNVWIEYQGERLTIADWAARNDVRPELYWSRLKRGWSDIDTLTFPSARGKSYEARKLEK